MTLPKNISKHNYYSFLWHAGFLAFAQNFIDVDTIIPAMVIEAGGNSLHVGIMVAIMMGGSSLTQLFFAPFVNNKKYKKKYLLAGINLRVISLLALAFILYSLSIHYSSSVLWFIFIFISLFSFSGAFTNISYVDVIGKSINQENRKSFFSARQIVGGIIVISTVFLAKRVLSSSEFPINYFSMFLIGGAALFIASAGFWNVKEVVPSGSKISGIKGFLKSMNFELKNNKKLLYFLGFINTQGVVISIIPFVMLYAKEHFYTEASDTGIFLLFKVIGVVTMSFFILILNKKIKYRALLFSNVFLSLLLALITIFISESDSLKWIFILGGFTVSLYAVTLNGVLLEISGNENRALYAGFAGAGNIIPTIFPLISAGIINQFGYVVFFTVFMIIISTSAFFIFKLKCIK
ncbi:MFS transporter [Lutibacter sp. TH_r2]|uniref:MFS transporter n=1 Tax=Lutibacter sp. TH_r2 TaxID=3082083 RepID=UPI00295429DE|nr:MFS transporter [Lutibacter sp. TH_r2]MDV7186076.1 MFS transporter [Lutibacter sp. TH_r2]